MGVSEANGEDVQIFWDGMWVRRIGQTYLPDPEFLETADPDWSKWRVRVQKYIRDAADYWFYLYQPQPGDTIVDVGAGRGEDVYAFSQAVGPTGRVCAIEPHPVSFQALSLLCQRNHLSNVTALNLACTDREGEFQIETVPVWESNYVRAGEKSASSYSVQGMLCDDVLSGCTGNISFLKMNIEGAERLALRGCRETLRRSAHVCIAAHDFRADRGDGEQFRTLAFVREFLEEAGFRLTTRDTDLRYYVPYHVHGVRQEERR